MTRRLAWLALAVPFALQLLLLLGCPSGNPPPVVEPTPPPPATPSPVCEPGATCGCWHQPPGQDWQRLPDCPTAPAGCALAGNPAGPAPIQQNTMGVAVNAAIKALRPDCEVDGTCLLGDMTQQAWQAQVIAQLRLMGFCAGQHSPSTDEIAVAARATDPWEGFHIFAGDDSDGPVPPGQPRRTVKWSPRAYTGSWLPAGTVIPPPPAQECPAPLPDRDPQKLRIVLHVGGGWADGTLQTVGTLAYCEAIGMSPMADGTARAGCPMRSECPGFQCDLRDECEAYASGGTAWETRPAGREIEHRQGNPWVARAIGAEMIRVCTADRRVCSPWAAAP